MLHPESLFINGPVRLTKTQSRVVDYMLAHPDEVIFMTASDLGGALGVSDATVVRVSQALGFAGFSEVKRHLQGELSQRRDTVSRLEKAASEIDSLEDVIAAVLRNDLENLRATAETTSYQTLAQVARVISRAPEVSIIGLRSAHSLAHFLASALRFLGRKVRMLAPGIGYLWADLRDMGPGSVLVAFSFPRYTKLTIEVVREAHQSGATVISFTDGALSPLATCSHYVIPASFRMDSFMESYVAALSLLNALVTAIAYGEKRSSLKHLGELERLWREKGVYFDEELRPAGDNGREK